VEGYEIAASPCNDRAPRKDKVGVIARQAVSKQSHGHCLTHIELSIM